MCCKSGYLEEIIYAMPSATFQFELLSNGSSSADHFDFEPGTTESCKCRDEWNICLLFWTRLREGKPLATNVNIILTWFLFKTRVLVSRIVHLLEQGINPTSILAVTFTNKAGNEMKSRVSDILEVQKMGGAYVQIVTFHGLCSKLLRGYGRHFLSDYTSNNNLEADFTIIDPNDGLKIIKTVIEHDFGKISNPAAVYEQVNAEKVRRSMEIAAMSSGHNFTQPIQEKSSNSTSRFNSRRGRVSNSSGQRSEIVTSLQPHEVAIVTNRYDNFLYSSNSLDFNDLIFLTLQMLRTSPGIRAKLQHKFKHILVDEFQDTDASQLEILRLLASSTVKVNLNSEPILPEPNPVASSKGTDVPRSTGSPERSREDVPGSTLPFTPNPYQLASIPTTQLQSPSLLESEETRKLRVAAINKTCSLFLVGDVNQSIYGWRGAVGGTGSGDMLRVLTNSAYRKLSNTESDIDGNSAHAPGVTSFALTLNYRCSPPIIAVANAILSTKTSDERSAIDKSDNLAGSVHSRAPEQKLSSQFLPVQVSYYWN